MGGVAGAWIWHQSFTDPDVDGPYFTQLSGYLRSVSSPGCEVEVFGIQPGCPASAPDHRVLFRGTGDRERAHRPAAGI
jgi:hypothetical protein